MAHLFDDAGLFPPAKLPMAEALTAHERASSGPHSRVVGPFLCPATRLAELGAVVVDASSAPAGAVSRCTDRPRAVDRDAAIRSMDASAAEGVGNPGEPGRDQPLQGAVPRPDPEHLRLPLLFPAEVLQPLQLPANQAGETTTRRCQGERFSPAQRQLGFKKGLQFADLTLAHRIARRRLGDASRLRHFEETAEPVKGESPMGEERFKHDRRVSLLYH